jgi:hypothetical protein
MVSISYIDFSGVQKRIVLTLDAGDFSEISVQDLYSKFKDEMMLSRNIHVDFPADVSGDQLIDDNNRLGTVVEIDNDWYIDTEDSGQRHRMRLTKGIWKHRDNTDPLLGGTNIIWSLAEATLGSSGENALAARLTAIEDQLGIYNRIETTSDGTKKLKIRSRTNVNTSIREYDIDSETTPRQVTPV